MRKKMRGSFTIEAAYIIPLILLMIGVIFHVLFYYHDKNILLGTAHETAAYGAGLEKTDEDTIESYFTTRIKGKLLLFAELEKEITVEDDKVTVICNARKSKMSLQVGCSVNRTDPEDYIRSVRKIKKIGEGIGNQN